LKSRLESHFFGLTPEYRIFVFRQIHEIVFHGKGGYDYTTIYNMPVWLRTFTYKSIEKFYADEKEQVEKAQTGNSSPKVPTYSTKARK